MRHSQVIMFRWTRTYKEIFKSALVYLKKLLLTKTEVLKTFIFSKLKKIVTRSVYGELQLTQIPLNFKNSCLQLKKQRSGSNTMCEFSVILILKGIMTFQS